MSLRDLVLKHEELIDPSAIADRILMPHQIPIHPSVYDSDFAYTRAFVQEVMKAVIEFMKADISSIETILRIETGLTITDKGVFYSRDRSPSGQLLFSDLKPNCGPGNTLGIAYRDANIDIDRVNVPTSFDVVVEEAQKQHPMPLDKLRKYAFERGESAYHGEERIRCHSWHVHNLYLYGIPLPHYFRNFAIAFNNLGLKHLQGS